MLAKQASPASTNFRHLASTPKLSVSVLVNAFGYVESPQRPDIASRYTDGVLELGFWGAGYFRCVGRRRLIGDHQAVRRQHRPRAQASALYGAEQARGKLVSSNVRNSIVPATGPNSRFRACRGGRSQFETEKYP
jgi:hypothetical protein